MKLYRLEDLDEERAELTRAIAAFSAQPEMRSFTSEDIAEGKRFFLRWGLDKDCILYFKIGDEPQIVQNCLPRQPAQQGSVPEPFGTDSAYTLAKEASKGNMAISCELVVELVEALRAATPQPEGNQWIKCSKIQGTDADYCNQVWGVTADGLIALFDIDELVQGHHPQVIKFQPTGLKCPQPPQEPANDPK